MQIHKKKSIYLDCLPVPILFFSSKFHTIKRAIDSIDINMSINVKYWRHR